MPTIDEIRRENLTALVAELGGNKGLAEVVGVSETQMSQWVKGAKESSTGKQRGLRLATCHRIEDATGKPRGWLDAIHATAGEPPAPSPAPKLPEALTVVLSRLPGLDDYTATKVMTAMDAAMKGTATLDVIEADLLALLQAEPSKRRRAA